MLNKRLITGEVKIDCVYVDEPYTPPYKKAEPRYTVTIVIPKSDTETIHNINEAVKAVESSMLEKESLIQPLRDGDLEKRCKDSYFMVAQSKCKPLILGSTPLDESNHIKVLIELYPFIRKNMTTLTAAELIAIYAGD